jgi:Protein of unknown function (DUF2752)
MEEPGGHRLTLKVRIGLVVIGLALIAVFVTATRVRPYDSDGNALKMGSHQTIGMPACNFREWFETPCPSCGMTTSFALLVRGDVWNSLKANWVGTMLALVWAGLIPWTIWSSLKGRYAFVREIEIPLGLLVGTFAMLLLIRWGLVLLWTLFDGG